MTTARIFQHGLSQAVRLPKDFRFTTSEVLIEKRGDAVVLRPVTCCQFKTFAEIAQFLAENFPHTEEIPVPPAKFTPRSHLCHRQRRRVQVGLDLEI